MFGLDVLAKTRRELDAAEAAWVRDVGEYDRSEEWRADGYFSPAAALRHACHLSQGVARAHVDLARKLERLPDVAAACGRGDLSLRHATVLADAFTPTRATELAPLEAGLVDVAMQCTPHELSGIVRRYTDAIDGDGGAATDAEQIERSGCYFSDTLDGMLQIDAQCDPLTGEVVRTAVEAEMQRDLQANDPRTTPQRRMDALANLCRLALHRAELGESHGIRPHLSFVIDANEIATPETIDHARLERRRNGRLSQTMLETLLCDCRFSRIVTAGPSEILDVGRASRHPTSAQWRALVARDRGCTHPGCTRPPSDCVAHHDWHWTDGGPTDLTNLRLVCHHHHRQQHINDARIRARPG